VFVGELDNSIAMSASTPQIPIQIPLNDLVSWLGASLQQAPAAAITSLSTDTRNVTTGTLFFALSGERFDGHSFVANAAQAGAAAVVVSRAKLSMLGALPSSLGVLVVDDPLAALQSLAMKYRETLPTKIIGVTGSVGKTTTKELLAAALIADAGEDAVLKTLGNLNSQIGLPLMVLLAKPTHRYLALEMGLSQFGEMHRLSTIAKPNVATITSIAEAHLEFLGSLDGVAKAKSEIFDGLSNDGFAVIPTWEERLRPIAKALEQSLGRHRVCYVGEETWADVQIEQGNSALGVCSSVSLNFSLMGHQKVIAEVPLIGEHHARNAALAVVCAVCAGADPERAAQGIARAKIPGGRSRLATEIKGFTVIDDSYNANPASMRAALASLSLVPGKRSVAILGDMKELGVTSKQDHYQIGQLAARSVSLLLAFGQDAQEYIRGAKDAGMTEAFLLDETIEHAITKVRSLLQREDRVLIKGSRSMKMERFLEACQ
jgi:UDP-N-acetylmuramoyl-tripeptide--D-alanyl-D-alanine ligase